MKDLRDQVYRQLWPREVADRVLIEREERPQPSHKREWYVSPYKLRPPDEAEVAARKAMADQTGEGMEGGGGKDARLSARPSERKHSRRPSSQRKSREGARRSRDMSLTC